MAAPATSRTAPLPAATSDTARASRSLLRLITCGSVDDGKSTLLGRLLFEAGVIPDDVLASLEADSARMGRADRDLDYSLLLDGLVAEREQGITIDVAYRYFATPRRAFIVADTPGHEQYTRNMATGASTADLAIILIDAGKGVLPQTRRHALIAAFVGVRHLVVAINKIDVIGRDESRICAIEADFRAAIGSLAFESITVIPLSARQGDNVASLSPATPWYRGPTLLGWLEAVDVEAPDGVGGFVMPVQWVNRPDADFRGFAGTVAAGSLSAGDVVEVLPARRTAKVTRIVTFDGELDRVDQGKAVTLVLDTEIDVSRGDVIVAAGKGPAAPSPVAVRTSLEARVLVTGQAALVPGATYLLRLGSASANATVEAIVHGIDIATYEAHEQSRVQTNELALVRLRFDRPLAVAPYARLPALGAFILVDKVTHETAAMGTVMAEAAPAGRPRLSLVGSGIEERLARSYGADWRRTLPPAISWRIGSALLLGLVVALLTGHAGYGLAAAVADGVSRAALGGLHHRLWERWSDATAPGDGGSSWAVRHADAIFKVLLVALAALWLVVPARNEPGKSRAGEAALVDTARPS